MGNGVSRAIEALRTVLANTVACRTGIALETMAGQGTTIGYRFEQLAEILSTIEHDRLGCCLDTSHAFAAGYNLGDPQGYEDTIGELDATIGLERVRVVHRR